MATYLETVASGLDAGEWATLTTTNFGTNGEILRPDTLDGYSILEYTDKMVRDDTNKICYFAGGTHAGEGTKHLEGGCIKYDENTNTWSQLSLPTYNSEYDSFAHAYDHNVFYNGSLYYCKYATRDIWKYTVATDTWDQGALTAPDVTINITFGFCYFPEINGLLWDPSRGSVQKYSFATSSWSAFCGSTTNNEGDTSYHNFLRYNPAHQCVVSGTGGKNGISGTLMYRIEADGTRTQLSDAPITMEIPHESSGVVFVYDPGSGNFLVFYGNSGMFYEFDPSGSGTWTQQGPVPATYFPAPYSTGYVDRTVAVPILSAGVVMFVQYAGSNSRVSIYKHALSNTPPVGTITLSVR